MYRIMDLSGEWRLEGSDAQNRPVSIPAQVPGYVHPAMEKAGLLEPIFFRDNAEKCQWIEAHQWTFSTTFRVPENAERSRAELRFYGVDTYADILLNGRLVYQTANMFLPFSVPVEELLREGENQLCVVIHPYRQAVEGKPECNAAFTWDRVYVRRIQCTFFWDWVNRFVSAGICGGVELAFPEEAVLEDVFAETADICETSASLRIQVRTQRAVESRCRMTVDIRSPEGSAAWDISGRVFQDTMYFQADIPDPKLWWPVGYGGQPLYTLTVTLHSPEGRELDRKTLRVGIRTVRFEMLRDPPGSEAAARTAAIRAHYHQQDNPLCGESYILLVNGRRIFCKGGNWVPASPFPGTVSDEHYRRLVEAAAQANMNLLRVWGGGIYESEAFYDQCDRLGVMVTQDFMLACGHYPDTDEAFVESYRQEVLATVLRLRSRTCLAAWTGNNENGDGFDWDDPATPNLALQRLVYRPVLDMLDPNRTFRPYGAYGGRQNTDLTIGDNHASWWWKGAENIDPGWFDFVGRFSSESPLEGYSLPAGMRRFLNEEDILDPDSPVADYHIKNNIYFAQMGLISVHDRLKRNTALLLGNVSDRYRQIYRLAYIQYEWARLTLEGMRRSKWYAAGIQYWMYNDCWPALGYAVIDYYGRPKAGWYATKYSGAPVAATMKEQDGTLRCIVLNDSFESGGLTYRVLLYRPDCGITELARGEGSYPSNENTELLRLDTAALGITDGASCIVFFELYRDSVLFSRARWYPGWLSGIQLPQAVLSCEADRANGCVRVTCLRGVALGVAIDGELIAEDNFLDLLEGETRTLTYQPQEGFSAITVYGYNTEAVTL